ncbi:DinB family protein [Paludibaculum fermentans]|uniref:DinB family protein n=1 Tax=Paludibaculum fermentans TaxID=1473598 RepID=UPI003EB725E1
MELEAPQPHKLATIYEGWDGYQTSLVRAAALLTSEHLAWRPAPGRRSIGEIFRHISLGRITWLDRMKAPGIDLVAERVPQWRYDNDGTRCVAEESVASDDPAVLDEWLQGSWQPIQRLLEEWTVDDLFETYLLDGYLISRQWTIWRLLSHDTHHGGQLAALLAVKDIDASDLREQGGHIIMPPRKPN